MVQWANMMHSLTIVIAKYFVAIPAVIWLLFLIRLPRKQGLRFVAFSVVSAVLVAILVKIGTTVHQDPRPFIRDHAHPYFTSSTDNGFPSDHSAFSAAIACILLRYNRKLGTVVFILAILIGAARVISGVHHGQDVVGGIAFALIGVGIAYAVDKLYDRFAPKQRTSVEP